MSDDFCLTHGYEHMKNQLGNPIAYCAECERSKEAATALEAKDKEVGALKHQNDYAKQRIKELEEERYSLADKSDAAEARAETAERVFTDLCDELGCKYDNEAALEAVATLRRERDEARASLKQCRTSINGYVITKTEQYPEALASIYRELRRIDAAARAITGED